APRGGGGRPATAAGGRKPQPSLAGGGRARLRRRDQRGRDRRQRPARRRADAVRAPPGGRRRSYGFAAGCSTSSTSMVRSTSSPIATPPGSSALFQTRP